MPRLEVAGHSLDLGLGLAERDAGFEPAGQEGAAVPTIDQLVVGVIELVDDHDGNEDVGRNGAEPAGVLRRNNAEDLVVGTVQADRPAHDRRIGRECPAPEPFTQHHHGPLAGGRRVGRLDEATSQRAEAQDLEILGRDHLDREFEGPAAGLKGGEGQLGAGDAVQRGHLTPKIRDVRLGQDVIAKIAVAPVDLDQPLRMADGRLPKDHIVDHREHRAVGPDAEGERQHRNAGECRASRQTPHRVAGITAEPGEPGIAVAGPA